MNRRKGRKSLGGDMTRARPDDRTSRMSARHARVTEEDKLRCDTMQIWKNWEGDIEAKDEEFHYLLGDKIEESEELEEKAVYKDSMGDFKLVHQVTDDYIEFWPAMSVEGGFDSAPESYSVVKHDDFNPNALRRVEKKRERENE